MPRQTAVTTPVLPMLPQVVSPPRARRTSLRLKLALLSACIAANSHAAPFTVTAHNFATRTLEPSSAFTLNLSEPMHGLAGRIAVFIGATDITATLQTSDTTLTYGPSPLGLPLGSQEVVVMFYDGATWIEVARLPLVVAYLGSGGAVSAPAADSPVTNSAAPVKHGFKTKIDLTGVGGGIRTSATGIADTTVNTHTGGLQGSLSDDWSGDDYGGWALRAQINAAGSSVRSQALRFAQRASAADKVDLASYLIEGNVGATRFSLGHVNAGQHPLLMNGLSFRGATISYPISANVDITLNAHNGSAIVGLDRPFGVYDDTHHFAGATVGYEVYAATKGRLRFEFAALDASVAQTQPGINSSATTTTQESAGIGIRALGTTEDARGRFDAAYATSRYRSIANDFSPATAATTHSAYLFDGSYQALREVSLGPRWPVTATITARHEYADPLYKSLGAGWAADYQQTAIGVQASVGVLSAQLAASIRNDNVIRLASALVNKVESGQLTFSAPLAQLLNIAPTAAIPAANLSFMRTQQWGTRAPNTLDAKLIPNIATDAVIAGLNWTDAQWTLALTGGLNKQDNRQLGSENKDIRTTTFGAQLGWRANEKLMLNLGITPNISRQTDTGLRRTTWNPNASLVLQLPWDVALTSSANFDRSYDSQAINGTRNWGFSNQLVKSFKVPVGWGNGTQAAQLSLRQFVTYANNRTLQGLVDSQTTTRSSGVMLNVSISLF